MPIRINLKEIFPSDPQEINVDKLNFNFNKLLELGVGSPGPIGLTGPQGPAGPIGLTGPQGDRGATWWVDSGDPNLIIFTGLIDGDLYLDQSSNAFEVYQYSESTMSWTSIVSIAAVVNSYLSTVAPSPFELSPIPSQDKFIVFKNRTDISDNTRGLGNNSTNNMLFLSNFDEDFIKLDFSTITFTPNGYTLGTYTNLATTGGSGDGLLTVNVTVDGSGDIIAVLTNSSGSGYIGGDIITIAGNLLGASTPTDDVTIQILPNQSLEHAYNSLHGIFVSHNDATPSLNADSGRYHFEYGSLYTSDGGITSDLSELKHNLKGRFYKKYITSPELPLTNEWINTFEFSLAPPNSIPGTIDENTIFEFITSKWNNETSPIKDILSFRLGSWEAQVEQGSEFNYMLADGISLSLQNSGTPLVTNIGIAINYQSAYPEIDNLNLFMLDSNADIDGILLNKNTYTVGDFQVFGKTTTDDFRLTNTSGITGQYLRSTDTLGNAEWADLDAPIISDTWSALDTLKSGSDLIPGQLYEITDSIYQNKPDEDPLSPVYSTCSIYIQALTANKFSTHAIRKMRVLKEATYFSYDMWRPGLTLAINDRVIWGARVWNVIANHTSSISNVVDNISLDPTKYEILTITSATLSEEKVFKVLYLFENDWVTTQYDNRGNIYTVPIDDYSNDNIYSGFVTGSGEAYPSMSLIRGRQFFNPLDFCDYGSISIINNNVSFISNNKFGVEISSNSSTNSNNGISYIVNNFFISGNIRSNSCPIYGNSNTGYITNNSCIGGIYSNDDGVVNIYNNSNLGSITGNSSIDQFDIYNNSNSGNISNNTNIYQSISNNSNLGNISNNNYWGIIGNNSNKGDIEENYLTDSAGGPPPNPSDNHILDNSNLGDIYFNYVKDTGSNEGIYSNSNEGSIHFNGYRTGHGSMDPHLRYITNNSNGGAIRNCKGIEIMKNNTNLGPILNISAGIIGNEWAVAYIGEYILRLGSDFETTNSPSVPNPLVIGARYTILDYNTGDDFQNVMTVVVPNATGASFVATGDTPTSWTNQSRLALNSPFNNDLDRPTVYAAAGIVSVGDNPINHLP